MHRAPAGLSQTDSACMVTVSVRGRLRASSRPAGERIRPRAASGRRSRRRRSSLRTLGGGLAACPALAVPMHAESKASRSARTLKRGSTLRERLGPCRPRAAPRHDPVDTRLSGAVLYWHSHIETAKAVDPVGSLGRPEEGRGPWRQSNRVPASTQLWDFRTWPRDVARLVLNQPRRHTSPAEEGSHLGEGH